MKTNSPWRWLRSVWFLVLFAAFALPFATVSCDAPGGFGRVGPGGTTTYSGFDLATGTAPGISEDHELPADQQREDEIAPQPLLLLGLLGLVGGAVAATTIGNQRRRRLASVVLAIASAAMIAAGQLVAQSRLTDLVDAQIVAGTSAGDYVSMAYGFWLVIAGLIAVAAIDLVLRWRQPGVDEREDDLRGAVSRNLESLGH